jgi:hypothetical protein
MATTRIRNAKAHAAKRARVMLPNPAPRLNKTGVEIGPKLAARVERGVKDYHAGRSKVFDTAEEMAAEIFGR